MNTTPVHWQTPEPPIEPAPGQLSVWRATLNANQRDLDRYLLWLSTAEKRRAERLINPVHQNRYIVAKAMLRHLLGHYRNIAPGEVHYRTGPKGKPYLRESPAMPILSFNATDCEQLMLIAIAGNNELGIDLEKLDRQGRFDQIVARRFAVPEHASLLSGDVHTRRHNFLCCWTRKEAYGKAIGLGIHYPLNEINLCEAINKNEMHVVDPDSNHWYLQQFYPDTDNVACLVCKNKPVSIHYYDLDALKP